MSQQQAFNPADEQEKLDLEMVEIHLLTEGIYRHYGFDFRDYSLDSPEVRPLIEQYLPADAGGVLAQFYTIPMIPQRHVMYVTYANRVQFLEDRQWIPVIGARYQMGADGVAVLLLVLTTFLGVLAALRRHDPASPRRLLSSP